MDGRVCSACICFFWLDRYVIVLDTIHELFGHLHHLLSLFVLCCLPCIGNFSDCPCSLSCFFSSLSLSVYSGYCDCQVGSAETDRLGSGLVLFPAFCIFIGNKWPEIGKHFACHQFCFKLMNLSVIFTGSFECTHGQCEA